jgi:hypothetical protein
MFLLGRGVFGLALLALWVYCILDVIATDDSRVRNLPKLPWLFIVVFVPTIGAIAWLLLGRPEGAGFAIGGAAPRRTGYTPHPDPYPNRLILPQEEPPRLESREEAIRRYQEQKKRREEEIERLESELLGGEPDPQLGAGPSGDDEDEQGPAER